MTTIQQDHVVTVHYTLTDDAGVTLDASDAAEPLAYLHGHGNIVPGLEDALTGRKAGESLKVAVSPEQGYGVRDQPVEVVPRNAFPADAELEVGMPLQAQHPNGDVMVVFVEKVDANEITLSGNHPLAGQTLHFDVKIVGVRAASAEELSHGHVHGAGGHHH